MAGQHDRQANKAGRPTRKAGQQDRQANKPGRPTWKAGQQDRQANKAGRPTGHYHSIQYRWYVPLRDLSLIRCLVAGFSTLG
jgi:hypothetical protein